MKERCLLAPLLLVLLALGGCLPIWLGLDSGLFSDKPCKAPCWQNLTPGQSTSQDVNHFLNGLSTKDWPGRIDKVLSTGCRWIRLTDKAGLEANAVADLYIEGGKLTIVSSNPFLGPTLKQVTNHFGPPEYFKAIELISFDAKLDVLEIYYPNQGIGFQVSVNENDVGHIRPNMRIDGIEYFPPGDLKAYLTAKNSCNLGQARATLEAEDEIANYIQAWSGYGDVDFKVIASQ